MEIKVEMGEENKKRKLAMEECSTRKEFNIPMMHIKDPKMFLCSICNQTLSVPVFQCQKNEEFLACSTCCNKFGNSCSSCFDCACLKRCYVMEKILPSIQVSCKNMEYGCKETLSFDMKSEHEKRYCKFAPCLCPSLGCNYKGLSEQLYLHFNKKHSNFVISFEYNCRFSVELKFNEEFCVLQELGNDHGDLFILNKRTVESSFAYGISSVTRIGDSSSERLFCYDISLDNEEGSSLKCKSVIKSYTRRVHHRLLFDNYLMIPNAFLDSCPYGDLNFSVRICKVE